MGSCKSSFSLLLQSCHKLPLALISTHSTLLHSLLHLICAPIHCFSLIVETLLPSLFLLLACSPTPSNVFCPASADFHSSSLQCRPPPFQTVFQERLPRALLPDLICQPLRIKKKKKGALSQSVIKSHLSNHTPHHILIHVLHQPHILCYHC